MNFSTDDSAAVSPLPNILVFSEDQISRSHGTGAMFLRTFSCYPAEKIFNVSIGCRDRGDASQAFDLNHARWPQTFLSRVHALPFRIWNVLVRPLRKPSLIRTLPVDGRNVQAAVDSLEFRADLIYAICYSAE